MARGLASVGGWRYLPGMSLLEENLAALEPWTPDVAGAIRAAAVPPGFQPATGTDGAATFLRLATDPATGARTLEWLGNTSMPAASAAPLTAALDAANSPGLALSIGTGHEWLALVQKLSSAHALYVYEPEPALLKMALAICDLAPHLAAGKIVLVTGPAPEAAAALAGFLAAHLGYEPPAVLHPLATLPPDRRNALLAAGESIVRHAVAARQSTVNHLVAELQAIGNRQSAIGNPVAITATPRYPAERPLHGQIARMSIPELRVDHHVSTSLAARLQFLITHRPGKILSDFFRGQLGGAAAIPPAIAVHTWIPPLAGPAFWQPTRLPSAGSLEPPDRIIVHAAVHQLLLESHGIAREQIEVRPLQTRHEVRTQHSALSTQHCTPRVSLIADLPLTDPAALGLDLPTPQAIDAAARDMIAADYLAVHFHSAADILRRAMRRAGVNGPAESNAALHDPMLRIIRDVLIPALPLLTLARNLLAAQIPLRLIGEWPGLEPSPLFTMESFPAFCASPAPWRESALLVHLSPWGTVSPLVLDAAAAGVPIVAPRHPTDALAGSLPMLLADDPAIRLLRPQPQQLIATIKSLFWGGATGQAKAAGDARRLGR